MNHNFDASPDEVAEVLLDPAFQDSLSDIGALAERSVLEQSASGAGVVRRVRCVLDIEMNGVARRFLGEGDPAWVEVSVWDPDALTWTWHIEPEVGKDLLDARGITRIDSSSKGTDKVIEADIRVKVPLYGGKVEGWISDGLRHAYDEEAERISDWLST